MTRSDWPMIGLVAAMVLVGGMAWWFELQPDLHVEPGGLVELPYQVGDWKGRATDVDSAVERILRADYNLQRIYRAPSEDEPIWLYVGYYGTTRGGHPEHMPAECYPSAGWLIESDETVELDPARALRATEYVVTNEGHTRLVHFWLRSSRQTGMLGTLDTSLDRLLGRLQEGRAEGALVRISTPILADGLDPARDRLGAFARRLDPLFDEHWPEEFPQL